MTSIAKLPPIRISVQSSEFAVRNALKQLLDGLARLDLNIEEAGTVELVMAEALNNIVEHAYPDSDAAGPIKILCKHATDGLHIRVVDTGRALPNGAPPAGTQADLNVTFHDLPEGGFGWYMINHLAKEVRYERTDRENRLTFRLAIATAESTP
jgi:serine/threonine-protein kinase RsbW